MSFYSILFETPGDRAADGALNEPSFFPDLNCDQIVAAITAGRDEYNLKPFFHACLHRVDAVRYRHDVMHDLENGSLQECVACFARNMRDIRDFVARASKSYYWQQQQAWFLDAVELYCRAVSSFADELSRRELKSRGFFGIRDYSTSYAASAGFNALRSEAEKLKAALAAVDYCVQIHGNGFTVRERQGEPDYSVEVEATFEKFKQGAARDYRVKFSAGDDMNHVEAKILEFVAKLNPALFTALDGFCARHVDFIDKSLADFDREVQFYVAYLEYIAALRRAGLQFCYPHISAEVDDVYDLQGFDIALAHKLVGENSSIVCNDFHLAGRERVLVISGPNQGGKTTFARSIGQLHYLASLGCPVPGSKAQLLLFDQLFTHFEKEERVEDLRGKLEGDLMKIRASLTGATSQSIIIMNEVFTSTTIQDETFLSRKVMKRILHLGALCVWVTFVDELASLAPQTVSMVSEIAQQNPTLRTFQIVRRPADGLAYAMAIAQKHRLTYDSVRGRLRS